jgi:predicted NBD/HSP70 family sugar kinase
MYLAIDIGGTKTLLAVFERSGRLLASERFETPKDYQDFITGLEKCYRTVLKVLEQKKELQGKGPPENETQNKSNAKAGIKKGVAGIPGRIERKSGIAVAFGNLDWENVPLRKYIEKVCGVPVRIENDANLAGLSEAILVSHAYKRALYVTISTGIGGTLITDGVINKDYADTEFGHMLFEHEGRLQRWEEFASGKAIMKKYGKKAAEIKDPAVWYAISRNIALGLTNVVVNSTPDVVIIGGGVGAHFEKFADRLQEEMMIYGTKMVSVPPLRKAFRAEEAVIYGCYELACQSNN